MTEQTSLPSLAGSDWLAWKPVREIFAAIGLPGFGIRAVGGAVRDTLLLRDVNDVDFATTALPEQVMECAREVGLKVIPTGFNHGTVSIIADGKAFEVTTLRRDVETYGRHAMVAYTDDWALDASRRDFTINALYADAEGTLFDPLGGYDDIADRTIRFIGDASERVREDYLRILRFFRFNATFGDGEFDTEALHACVKGREGLHGLSAERVNSELIRLLSAPGAVGAVWKMFDFGLLVDVLDAAPHLSRFERLTAIEAYLENEPDAMSRLAALAIMTLEDTVRLTERLRLSNTQAKRLEQGCGFRRFTADMDDVGVRSNLYAMGRSGCRAAVLIAWAASGEATSDSNWHKLLRRIGEIPVPELPLQGADIVKMGVPPGPVVGEILRDIETHWIAGDFKATRTALLEMAQGLTATLSGGSDV